MKRVVILFCIIIMLVSFSISAENSVLLDFSLLTANMDDGENEATLLDFAKKAGSGFTDAEKALMRTSLSLTNWEVVLASSSRTVINQSSSKVLPAPVSAGKYAGAEILGIRIHFPEESFNSWALIRPPFEIPAYMKKTTVGADGSVTPDTTDTTGQKFENGLGVVKNVGVLKSVTVNVYGNNFPNGLGIILKDQTNREQNIFLDYMNFNGWKTITWNNPNYIKEVRNRELKRYPLYPRATPMVKFLGFIIYKDASQEGGDTIAYIKDVNITYDLAVLTQDRDIQDEALWGIMDDREESRRNAEFLKLGEIQVLRYIERQKMHPVEEETDSN